jgi:predicted transcriptional regulator
MPEDDVQDIRTPSFVLILKLCINGCTKNRILKSTSLTKEQLRLMTAELIDRELLRYIDSKRIYITSDKGHQFLSKNSNCE